MRGRDDRYGGRFGSCNKEGVSIDIIIISYYSPRTLDVEFKIPLSGRCSGRWT